MFTGPSNVGKTLLTGEIAKIMKSRLFRLDMSEYTDSSSLNKLLGSPVGYIGSEDGSLLSKLINENPRCVLHLDNILSANNSILNMICQIMDNGYITDSKGKEINFKNVILILTQNTPQNAVLPIGGDIKSKLTFNSALNFNSLSDDDLAKVTEKELEKINTYLIKKNIKIVFPKEIILQVSKMAKDKNLGTSGIKTAIEDSIMNQLKEKILFGDLMNIQELKEFTLFYENDKFLIK
jgi:ATP-dependent Clp protease ATP-binding subunit ClpA